MEDTFYLQGTVFCMKIFIVLSYSHYCTLLEKINLRKKGVRLWFLATASLETLRYCSTAINIPNPYQFIDPWSNSNYNLNKPTFHEYFYYNSYLIESLVCLLVTENGARNPLKRICKINEKIVNRQGFKTK